jgi:ubiquinone/menaquinone biosynthesis C-methylase UbiE
MEEERSTAEKTKGEEFVSALGKGSFLRWAAPLYQTIVDVFCRDDYVKGQVVSQVDGEGLQIVDIACGTGKLVQMLATKLAGCQVTGMDIDDSMVERARSTTAGIDNVNILKGSCAERLPFDDSTVDVVIESLVFHHLKDEDKAKAVREIARVLKPDVGRFFFVDWVQPSTSYARMAFEIVKFADGPENLQVHESNEVLTLIEEFGGMKLSPSFEPEIIQTSLGTLSIVSFHIPPLEEEFIED